MDFALGIAPIHVHSNVACSGPIDGADIVFVENLGKMVSVFFANIFMPKSSTQRVKEMGRQLCRQRPGVVGL